MTKVIELFPKKDNNAAKERAELLERLSREGKVAEIEQLMNEAPEAKNPEASFDKIMQENKERKERQLKERQTRNDGVKKSFKIDKKK